GRPRSVRKYRWASSLPLRVQTSPERQLGGGIKAGRADLAGLRQFHADETRPQHLRTEGIAAPVGRPDPDPFANGPGLERLALSRQGEAGSAHRDRHGFPATDDVGSGLLATGCGQWHEEPPATGLGAADEHGVTRAAVPFEREL